MKNVVHELREIVNLYTEKIATIPEPEFSTKPLPNKWSKKEVLGHLTDSGHNNLRRFICGQYEANPSNIIYDQDFWVKSQNYQHRKPADVIQHWKMINDQICEVLSTMPKENYLKQCNTGKGDVQLHSLQWLAEDYVKHLKHHLNQIIPNSFQIVYP